MKRNSSLILAIVLLIVVGSVFRVIGFAPQLAMAVFGAVVIKDKRLAFSIPLLSMFLSDVLFEILYRNGYVAYGGFYEGQIINYLLIAGITLMSFWARNKNWAGILATTIIAPSIYFLFSNLFTWLGGGGYNRPKTFNGLIMCYNDAVPFFRSGLINAIIFSAILFGGYYLLLKFVVRQNQLTN
ncbi:MAG: DUF6580 family putative transport protein [Flavisolibacter sp.]